MRLVLAHVLPGVLLLSVFAACGDDESDNRPWVHASGSSGQGGADASAGNAGSSGSKAGSAGQGGTGGPAQGGAAGEVGQGGAAGDAGGAAGDTGGSAQGGAAGTPQGGAAGAGGYQCGEPTGGLPPPGSGPCSFPQGVPNEGFHAWSCVKDDTDPSVDAAVNAVMASLSGCGAGSDCDLTGFGGTSDVDSACQAWFAAVTQELRNQGYCAGQHEVGSTDEIAVSNTGCTGKWYGYHVCFYGGPKVVWNPGARRPWWMIKDEYCP